MNTITSMKTNSKDSNIIFSNPKDSAVILAMLKDLGITDYEPRIIRQLLEFSRRYVVNVLEEAKTYSGHAGREFIDTDDVKLALMMQMDKVFSSPPPRDLMMEVASIKNFVPLPLIKENREIFPFSLPPEKYCYLPPRKKNIAEQTKKQVDASKPSSSKQTDSEDSVKTSASPDVKSNVSVNAQPRTIGALKQPAPML